MDVTTATEAKLAFPSYLGREKCQPNPVLLHVQKQKEHRSMPLRALMADHCARRGFPYEAVWFNHDGGWVPKAKSAEDLGEDVNDARDYYHMRGRILLIDLEEGCTFKLVTFIVRLQSVSLDHVASVGDDVTGWVQWDGSFYQETKPFPYSKTTVRDALVMSNRNKRLNSSLVIHL